MRGGTKTESSEARASIEFDAEWYRQTYRDVDILGMDPLEHYLWLGRRLGRRPHPNFLRTIPANVGEPTWCGPEYIDFDPPECSYFKPKARLDSFVVWQELNRSNKRLQILNAELVRKGKNAAVGFSVLIPVYNPPIDVLEQAIESVLRQSFDEFELILADDCSSDMAVRPVLQSYADRDSRVKVIFRENNGHISEATNSAADAATFPFLVFVDNDDMLHEDALAHFAAYVADHPSVDIIYSDDAKISPQHQMLHSPKFKPDWSPELLLSYCYISHLKAVRKELYERINGSRRGFEGSQDHDMLLRAGELARDVGHIPQVLYQRRVLPTSTAASGNAKPYSFEAGRRAAEEAFHRRGVACTVEHPNWAKKAAVGIYVPVMPDVGPLVSILIPTKDNWRILDRLLKSLETTSYKNYEIIVIDNVATEPDTIEYYKNLRNAKVVTIPNPGNSFNFASINNEAANLASGEFLLFLNDDTEVIEPKWLSQMVGWAKLPGVGAVGARLLFPDGRVQHAGVVIGLRDGLTALRGLEREKPGYLWYARVSRNVLAVTAACMLTPRKLFLEMNGFDKDEFAVAYNDVDYCLRLHQRGFRSVFCGEAELFHHEGYTRPKGDNPREIAALRRHYGHLVDPYYNPHLGIDDNRYGIKPTVVPGARSKDPIRVLAITHNLNHEGAPNSAFELISGLGKRGRVNLTVCSPQDGPLRQKYADAGIDVTILDRPRPLENLKTSDEYDRRVSKFCEQINITNFDVLYANTATTFWAIDAARRHQVPAIWNIRESESWKSYFNFLPPEVGATALGCFSYPYRVVFVADSTRRRWSPIDQTGNFDTIHNGVDLSYLKPVSVLERQIARQELAINESRICLLEVGTTAARKGQHEILQAILALPQNIAHRISVLIVGLRDSPYGKALQEFAFRVEKQTGAEIRLIPETGATRKYWSAADFFVCTSRLESYPRVILEAMALHLPIITTPTFGIREQVRSGYNALIYKHGDIGSLASHIERLSCDTALRKAMADWSIATLESLESYEGMLAKYENRLLAAVCSSPIIANLMKYPI